MIQLQFSDDHLDVALRVIDKFRSLDDSRPVLTTCCVRLIGSLREKNRSIEFVATDSYRLVRVTVPVGAVADENNVLRNDGVLMTLPHKELARLRAAVRRSDRYVPDPLNRIVLTISEREGATRFGITPKGAWNGSGCYLLATNPAGESIDTGVVAGGAIINPGSQYPNWRGLIPPPADRVVNLTAPLGLNARFIKDLMDAAAAFDGVRDTWGTPSSPIRLAHADDPHKVIVWTVSPRDGRTFEAASMPIRLPE